MLDKEVIPFILMQRTQYLERSLIYRALGKVLRTFGYNKIPGIIKANQLLNSGTIKNLYWADMKSEYDSISEHIPSGLKNILDIGCGIGGIDALLAEHYKFDVNIFLIDKSVVDKNYHYGYETSGSFYNSLKLSKVFLKDFGVPDNRIFLQEATPQNSIEFDVQFDLIISLISWGFHYPVETYLNSVHAKLNANGVLLLDIRKETNGLETIKGKFGFVKILKDFGKFYRVKAEK